MGVVDTKTLAVTRRYTDKSVAGGGAIKGKNCVVDSIMDITGGHRVTFKWTLDDGTVQTGYMDVMDGVDGVDGADGRGIDSVDINANNHLIITYDDGTDYDAGEIQVTGQTIQRNQLPTASATELGHIYQYIGANTTDLVNGYFYQCVADGVGYKWEEKAVQRAGGSITVDTELDPTSHNAVENMAIAVPIQALQGSMANVKLDISQLQASDLSLRTAIHDLDLLVASKVDKEVGKGLSTEDFTTAEKQKLDNLADIKQIGTGLSLNPATGELEATGVAIEIDPTLDPTSAHAIQNQAVAIPIAALQGSMANVKLDISALQGSLAGKVNSSDLGTAAYKNVPASGDASNSEVVLGSDSRLTDARNAADVPAWAKAATKPTYTASEVGAVATTDVGSANGIAPLGSDQKVPAANLPSYVDDVLEYSSQSSFPATGESGKIYVDLSTNKTYRWSGTTYVVVGGDLALGETANTAYAGNKGKANADAIDAIKDGTNIDSFADVETALSGKQATISDLATIRSGAEAGATAVQPNDLNNYYSTADTAETTIDDADYFPFYDASATGKRKTLFSSIVDKLKATFQTVSLADFTGDLNTLTTAGYKQYKAKLSDLTNAPTVSYTPMECYIDVWSDTNNIYQAIRIIGLTYSPSAKYSSTFKRSSYNTGSSLSWGAWEQIDGKISITPTPAATITDAALKTAINGAASSENKAPSAYAMKKWSNVLTKRYIVEGTSDPSTSPIGTTGIGTWYDGDEEDIDPSTDEADWLDIGDLTGIESSDDVDVSIKFDPLSGEPIALGGYIIDTTTGKMCLKFGNTIATPANARVAIDIAFMRNEFSVI